MSRFNVGGTSKWLYHLCKGLDQHGIENLLAIGDCPDYEVEDLRVSELKVERIPGLNPSSSIRETLQSFFHLRRVIKSFNPDIINTHASKGGFVGRLAAISLNKNVRVIHTYHGHVLKGYFAWPKQSIIHLVEFGLSFFTHAFIVVGKNVLGELRNFGIIRSTLAVSVLPAVEDFEKDIQNVKLTDFNVTEHRIVIGWLGRKVQIKRLDRILEIARLRPELQFLIAGVGNSVFTTYKEKFHKNELLNVTELGYILPSEFWQLCDISILTSDNEGVPSAPIEAALARVPTIATDVGSADEVIINGISGFITSTDLTDILDKVDELSENFQLRKEMGGNARALALSRFTPRLSIDNQISVYKTVLSQS